MLKCDKPWSLKRVFLWVISNMSSRFMTDLKNIFKRTKLFGSLFCCTLTLSSCSTEFKTSTDYLIAGKEYFKAGDYKKAEVEFQKALKKEPDSATVKATATNNLGVIYNEQGRFDDAINVLKEATTVDPKNAIARYVLANALTKKGRFDEALVEAQMSTELDKSEPGAYRALAEAALGKGDVALAITSYRLASHLEPDKDRAAAEVAGPEDTDRPPSAAGDAGVCLRRQQYGKKLDQ